MSLQKKLTGTGVALVTPFTTDGTIDFKALSNIIDYVIEGKVDYIVTLGTTGETPTLDKAEKKDIIQFTFEKVAKRVPIVVGIGGNNTKDVIQDLENLTTDETLAILSASPYYNKPSDEGLFLHYKSLAEASSKPIILYNVPGRTGRNLHKNVIIRLANEVPNIVALKEAGDDMQQCMELLKEKPDHFTILSGDDALSLSQIACGMKGVISVAANAFPATFSTMVREALKYNFKEAQALHYRLLPAYSLLFEENNPAGVKAFMSIKGLLENSLRLPLVPLSQKVFEKVQAFANEFPELG